jgi:hypothetical protein
MVTTHGRGKAGDRRPGAGLLKRVKAFRVDSRLKDRLAARAKTVDVMELPEYEETAERRPRLDRGYGHGV